MKAFQSFFSGGKNDDVINWFRRFSSFLSFRFPFVLSLKKSFDGLCVFVSIFVYRFVRLVLCREIFHCLCRSRFLVCPPSFLIPGSLDVRLSTAARCDGKVCFKCFSLEE